MASSAIGFRTKADLAEEYLRRRVLSGQLAPGERVPISHVARELGISDIPVREGVTRLEAEGLLQIEAHKVALVTRLGAHEIEELFAVRAELEALAMRRAARALAPEHLERLAALIEQMEIAEHEGRADDYGHLNREFHFAIYEAQPYKRLLGMIRDLWNSTDLCRRIFARDAHSLQASTREHRGIYDALCQGDGDTAAALLVQQKQRSCAWLLEHVEAGRVREPEPNTDLQRRNG